MIGNVDMLYDGYCVLVFKYSDGSEVQCVSTLNLNLLQSLELEHIDNFIDFLSYKIIPDDLFLNTELYEIRKGKETDLSELDKYFQSQIKRWWQDV